MNRRELFGIGFGALLPLPALAKPVTLPVVEEPTCLHVYGLWPRTAMGEDLIRQCVNCGDKQRKKMEWCPRLPDSKDFYLGERSISEWQPDGKSDPKWIKQALGIQLR